MDTLKSVLNWTVCVCDRTTCTGRTGRHGPFSR